MTLQETLHRNDDDFKRATVQTLGILADHGDLVDILLPLDLLTGSADDLRRKLFNTEMISAIQSTLADNSRSVRESSLHTLTVLANHGEFA